jgi:hypothetical protein
MPILPAASDVAPSDLSLLEQAILQTVAYVDMYDYPLTVDEIHRYLIEVRSTKEEVGGALENGRLIKNNIEKIGDYYFLAGRGDIVETRRQRAKASQNLWPHAAYYGRLIAALPFVSMVAVTGSLAVDNVDENADIDYLIVTKPGRLWLSRAMVITLVRRAARRGIALCPNYFISEQALSFGGHNLYSAHEIVQMVPVSGMGAYNQLRMTNPWVKDFLPNSGKRPHRNLTSKKSIPAPIKGVRWLGEIALRTPPGDWLEQWEMNRKVSRFTQQSSSETAFSADYCKGHFEAHGVQTMNEFSNRWQKLAAPTQEKPSE